MPLIIAPTNVDRSPREARLLNLILNYTQKQKKKLIKEKLRCCTYCTNNVEGKRENSTINIALINKNKKSRMSSD